MKNNFLPNQPLLTIAIPTWNRERFLDRCLSYLENELKTIDNSKVEIIVSDNFSRDNTQKIVKKYQNNDIKIKYFFHKKNFGSDYNFISCLKNANGRFIQLLSDDDIIVENKLKFIIKILECNTDAGVVFLSPYGFDADHVKEKPLNFRNFKIFSDGNSFISKLGVNISLISSLIIRNDKLGSLHYLQDQASELIQVEVALNAILNSKKNIFCYEYCIAVQRNNGGNNQIPSKKNRGMRSYNPAVVFGIKFHDLIHRYLGKGLNYKTFKLIEYNILFYYLPKYILSQISQKSPFYLQSKLALCEKHKSNVIFSLLFKPIFFKFYPLNFLYGFFVMIIGKIIFERYSNLFNHLRLLRFKIL